MGKIGSITLFADMLQTLNSINGNHSHSNSFYEINIYWNQLVL